MAELTIHERIFEERRAALPEAKMAKTFRQYYRGRHRSTQTRAQAQILRGVLANLFCDNICRKVINETASRHELLSFEAENEGVEAYLADLFTRNAVGDLQADAAVATLRDGNHAVSLEWHAPNPDRPTDGRVIVHRERVWDGESGVFAAFGRDGQPEYAVRDWKERGDQGEIERRVVWFPDRIERYVKHGDGWRPYPLPDDPAGTNGVVPWVKSDGSPLHVPIVWMANGSDDDTAYGASELDGGVLGLQDEINDIQRDITATARLTGYQMYWATGSPPQVDTLGNVVPLAVGPGQTLQTGEPNARFGVLPAGDLTQLKAARMVKLEAIGQMTDTPIHDIIGQWPSGSALIRADMPKIAKVNRLNKMLAPQWASVAHKATELANAFGPGPPLDESALITAVFAAPEKLDPLAVAEVRKAEAEAQAAIELLQDEESLIAMGIPEDEARRRLARRSAAAERLDARLTGFPVETVAVTQGAE